MKTYTPEELKSILELHRKWVDGDAKGCRAILRDSNLSGSDLSYSDLSGSDLSGSDLSGSDLSDSDLSGSDLSYSDLSGSDLSGSNLRYSNLSCSNLSGSDLSYSDLSGSDLSGAKGLLDPVDFLAQFEHTDDGLIVYKTFGEHYCKPETWVVEPGSVITEVVNPDRGTLCGSGVNVATLDWVKRNCDGKIWKCLIRWEWLAGVVVPFNTDGKIRASRVELLGPVE